MSTSGLGGTLGSSCFACAVGLETSNGLEISGLNSSQMSDIRFNAKWTTAQVTGVTNAPAQLLGFVHYDAMLVLKASNVVNMIF